MQNVPDQVTPSRKSNGATLAPRPNAADLAPQHGLDTMALLKAGSGDRYGETAVQKTTVVITGQDPVASEGLAAMMARLDDFQVRRMEPHILAKALPTYGFPLDVVLLQAMCCHDLRTWIGSLKNLRSGVKTCVVLSRCDPKNVGLLLASGMRGLLLSSGLTSEVLASCMRTVCLAEAIVLDEACSPWVGNGEYQFVGGEKHAEADLVLSPRQSEILQRLARGLSQREVARELGISDKTVQSHVAHVMEKVGAGSLFQLGEVTARMGLRR